AAEERMTRRKLRPTDVGVTGRELRAGDLGMTQRELRALLFSLRREDMLRARQAFLDERSARAVGSDRQQPAPVFLPLFQLDLVASALLQKHRADEEERLRVIRRLGEHAAVLRERAVRVAGQVQRVAAACARVDRRL